MNSTPTAPPSPTPPPERSSNGILPGVAVVLLLVVAVMLGNLYYRQKTPPAADNTFITPAQSFEKPVVVDISGHVKHPGVYELPFNARIYQAIEKAGGALPDADLSAINRAAWVEDGSKIEVPAKAAPQSTFSLELPETMLDKSTFESPEPAPIVPSDTKTTPKKESPKTPAKQLPAEPIDLNRATAAELQLLPGIGPAMAERILQYRKQLHGFRSVDDLDGVRGIGPKTLEKIRPFVTVKPLPFQTATPPSTDTSEKARQD